MRFSVLALCGVACAVLAGCGKKVVHQAAPHVYTQIDDTRDHTVTMPVKRVFHEPGWPVYASNQFNGARLDDFTHVTDTLFQASIRPENLPINPSPWYAFKLWSGDTRKIAIELHYGRYRHRYSPKISHDGKNWLPLDTPVRMNADSTVATLSILTGPDTLWIAAQEVVDSHMVTQWCEGLTRSSKAVAYGVTGQSKLGRPIPFMTIGTQKHANTVVLLSRQHPPEVTGYFALQHFVARLLENDSLATAFRKQFNVLVFPLLNPDGVDLGYWRHNAGGIDLNRDWANYHQPETRLVADYVTRWSAVHASPVILGLDFHSTYSDVYYTLDHKTAPSVLPDFTKQWFSILEQKLEGYKVREQASGLTRAVSKNWFNAQFHAEGVTYEIGDQTPRDFIAQKGRASAEAMMQLLIKYGR